VNALDRRQFEKLVIAHPSRHEDPSSQRPVPDQAGDAEPELVDEETRFTNKSADRDAPGSLSRLAMGARTSRRVNGSLDRANGGHRAWIVYDLKRPSVRLARVHSTIGDGRLARIHHSAMTGAERRSSERGLTGPPDRLQRSGTRFGLQ
jgi:hypothetical protein